MDKIFEQLNASQCPHQFWQKLREEHGPIIWSEEINSHAVLGHLEAKAIIDSENFSSCIYSQYRPIPLPIRSSFELPHPLAKQFRKTIHEGFAYKYLPMDLIVNSIQHVTQGVIESKKSHIDFIGDFSKPLAKKWVQEWLNLSDSELNKLTSLLELANAPGKSANNIAAGELFVECLNDILFSNQKQSLLLQPIISKWQQQDQLTQEDLTAYVAQIVFSLTQGTANQMLNNIIAAIIDKPSMQKQIRQKGLKYCLLLAKESARWEPINQAIPRVCRKAIDISGHQINTGETVFIILSAVCRDPNHHPDPHEFNPLRTENSLTFGRGKHTCLGRDLSYATTAEALMHFMNTFDITHSEEIRFAKEFGKVYTQLPLSIETIRS